MTRARTTQTARRAKAALTFLALAASSLLFVAATVVWVRSLDVYDLVIWRSRSRESWVVGARRGQVMIGHSLYPRIDYRRTAERPRPFHSSARPWGRFDAGTPLDPCRTMTLNEGIPRPPPRPPPPPGPSYHPRYGLYVPYVPARRYLEHASFRTHFDKAGFAYQDGLMRELDDRGSVHFTVVSSRFALFPCWSIALASAAGPALWVGRRLLRRRGSRLGSGFDVSPAKPHANGPTASDRATGTQSDGRTAAATT